MTEQQQDLFQKFAALASLLGLIAIFSFTSNAFFSVGNGMTVALQVTSIAYLGIAATCVIITGGIDLSVGAILALAGVVAAMLVKAGAPVPLGMFAGLLVGALCGLINGLCVTVLKLPPFIATLGMMLVARGVALQLTDAPRHQRPGRQLRGTGQRGLVPHRQYRCGWLPPMWCSSASLTPWCSWSCWRWPSPSC
jgi:ribose transport system permease protein